MPREGHAIHALGVSMVPRARILRQQFTQSFLFSYCKVAGYVSRNNYFQWMPLVLVYKA